MISSLASSAKAVTDFFENNWTLASRAGPGTEFSGMTCPADV
jgi:hypothetical protein